MNHRIGRKAAFGVVATLTGALALGAVAEAAGPGLAPQELVQAQAQLANTSSAASPEEIIDDRQVVARLRDEAQVEQARRDALVRAILIEAIRQQATTTTTAPAPTTTAPPTTAPPTTAPPAPAPTVPPAPAPSGSALDAIAAWFPDVYDQAVHVARCESSLNPGAMSPGGGNHGLFQLNNVHAGSFAAVTGQSWDARYNAYYNAQFARYLYNSSGWRPWACRP